MFSLSSESDSYTEVSISVCELNVHVWINWHTMYINPYAIVGNAVREFLINGE